MNLLEAGSNYNACPLEADARFISYARPMSFERLDDIAGIGSNCSIATTSGGYDFNATRWGPNGKGAIIEQGATGLPKKTGFLHYCISRSTLSSKASPI